MIRYAAFLLGLTLLLIGSCIVKAPDWDITISIIMAVLTLLTSEYWLKTVITFNWKHYPLAFFLAWISVDGSSWLYWSIVNPVALELRDAALAVNVYLYMACAVIFTACKKIDNELLTVRNT